MNKIDWIFKYDKETYQGTIRREFSTGSFSVYSRVFYIPEVDDVYFTNIEELPMALTEKYRQEIKNIHHFGKA